MTLLWAQWLSLRLTEETVTYEDQIRGGDQREVGSNGNVLYNVQNVNKLFTVNQLHGGRFVMTLSTFSVDT